MASAPDRNDPCWCGSGKKYKKCHLQADEAASLRPEWRRLRDGEIQTAQKALDWGYWRLGRPALLDALEGLRRMERALTGEALPADPGQESFEAMALLAPIPVAGLEPARSLARAFLDDKAKSLEPLQSLMLEGIDAEPHSFWRVLQAQPGVLVVEDMLLGGERRVRDQAASAQARPGTVLFGRVIPAGGDDCVFMRLAPMAFTQAQAAAVGVLKQTLAPKGPQDLRKSFGDLMGLYFVLRHQALRPAGKGGEAAGPTPLV